MAGDAYNSGEVHVISGADMAAELWVPDQSALWLHGPPDSANRTWFDWAGDLNGDGRGDLMARHQDWTSALILITPSDGLRLDEIADDVANTEIVRGQGFGTADLLGDINGDGADDIALAVANPEGASDMGTYLALWARGLVRHSEHRRRRRRACGGQPHALRRPPGRHRRRRLPRSGPT